MLKANKKVLICDDDADLAAMTKIVLTADHCEVEWISRMEKFLDVIASFQPRIILMDLHMPQIDGENATKLLRQHPEFFKIPIVLFSANSDLPRIAQNLGVKYLQKPFDIKTIRGIINDQIESI